jgi:LmbE family N-acetylglucosaminyl deacetylase
MTILQPKTGIIIIAHPDDEIIFLWAAIPYAKMIIAIAGDTSSTTQFPQYKNRKYALRDIGNILNIPTICLEYDSEFYKLPKEELSILQNKLQDLTKNYDIIFTHNEFGDYGHPDHLLLYKLVALLNKKIIVSDITLPSSLGKVKGKSLQTYQNDIKFYEQCHQIYIKHNCWTWNRPPIYSATLVEK